MPGTLPVKEFQGRLGNLEGLLEGAGQLGDAAARRCIQQIVTALLDLHGAGLERLMEWVSNGKDAGRSFVDACCRDDVAAGLLLLHGLHPLELEERVRQALDSVRPYLRSHGGNVELLDIRDGVVQLQLQGSCHHCPSSSVTMQQTIEEAIYGKAPEVIRVEVEKTDQEPVLADHEGARVPLVVL